MKIMLMKMMMSMAILSIIMKTPLSMMILLLTQTISMITLMNKMFFSSWFPMITFLMMIGGIMIIFMYMSSITSNEKFKMNFKISMIFMLIMINMEDMMCEFQINENQQMKFSEDLSMTKMYNKTMSMTLLMIMYLLMSMLAINKIIKNFEGPMRSKTYE